jgi:hypothetical protein
MNGDGGGRGATPPEEEVAADEIAVGSAGATADGIAVGSAGLASRAGESAVAEAVDGPSREGLTGDTVTTGSRGPGEAAGTSADAEGPFKAAALGSRRVIKALMGTSTSSGTSEAKPCWQGSSSPLETSTTTGCRGKEWN